MINGVDYASVDGNRPPQIEGSGMSFAIVRGAFTYKDRVVADSFLKRDRDSWRQHNVTFGSYLILSYGSISPEEQASAFIAAYGDRRPGELPPCLDLESNSADCSIAADTGRLDYAQRAYDVLVQRYGIVMSYTSCYQWHDHFGGKPSRLGDGPLWIKVPYAYKAHNRPHPETCPSTVSDLPLPWRPASSPGAWIVQYQGDAIGAPGFSAAVDLNGWLVRRDSAPSLWIRQLLARHGAEDVRHFQKAKNLVVDGVIGPKTFSALTFF